MTTMDQIDTRKRSYPFTEQEASAARLPRNMLQSIVSREMMSKRINPSILYQSLPPTSHYKPAWGALFMKLLSEKLAGKPCCDQIVYRDETSYGREFLTIELKRESEMSARTGRMQVILINDNPAHGSSIEETQPNVDTWDSVYCKRYRKPRIYLRPKEVALSILHGSSSHNTLKLIDFPSWEHTAQPSSTPYSNAIAVYHEDHNTSYPPVTIVAQFIEALYNSRYHGM